MVMTAALFPGLCAAITLSLNFVAIGYSSLAAIPFGSMVAISLIYIFICCPLVLAGTVFGRNWSGTPDFPCRVNTIPRHIPESKWYLKPWVMVSLGGVLPFGSIFIEMYFIFTSFWNYKFYYVYDLMLVVFLMLLTVISCVSIVITYFQLNAEDYRCAD